MGVVKDISRAVKEDPSCGETRVATTDDHYFLFVEVLDTLNCFLVAFFLQDIVGQKHILGSVLEEREPRVEVGVDALLSAIGKHNGLGAERHLHFTVINDRIWWLLGSILRSLRICYRLRSEIIAINWLLFQHDRDFFSHCSSDYVSIVHELHGDYAMLRKEYTFP